MVTKPADLPETMEEEFELAKKEGRQPRCVHCGKPLDRVEETQLDFITWIWDKKTMSYIKQPPAGDTETPYCANCGAHDYEFTQNDFIDY